MIKAVLIDDERPALRELEYLLKGYNDIEVIGMFTNPSEAINEIEKLNPQIVFLDINMLQLKGMDAASSIIDRRPRTDIVFVTAYDQYAIEAFELNALDYLLKPVSKERFDKTIKRVINKSGNLVSGKTQKRLIIQTFGKFRAGWEMQEPIKWRTEKTKELFAFLLHNAGREVSKDEILEAVFYGMDIERSRHQLHNGIYYIRKTLQEYGVERNQLAVEGNYLLMLDDVEVDSMQFKKDMQQGLADEKSLEAIQRLESLYIGDYFEGMDWVWAESEREKLSKHYLKITLMLGKIYIRNQSYDKAEEILLKAFKKNPYIVDISEMLIKTYKLTGRRNNAIKHYAKYEKIIKEELEAVPEQNIQELVKGL